MQYIISTHHWLLRLICVVALTLGLPIAQVHAQAQTQVHNAKNKQAFDFIQTRVAADAPNSARTESAQVRLLAWAPQGVGKNKPLWLGLYIQHQRQWHSYWKNPGQAGAAAVLQWQLPKGWQPQAITWATPQTILVGDWVNYGYDHDVLLAVPVQITADVPANTPLSIGLNAQWLACKTACVPQQVQLQLELPSTQAIQADAALFEQLQASTPKQLPNAQAQVVIAQQQATIEVAHLPAAWRGKTLNFYPETPHIFTTEGMGVQTWQGDTWRMVMPLDSKRQAKPKTLPIVLALQADAARNTEHIINNAAKQASYRVLADVQGHWQPAAAAASTLAATTVAPTASTQPSQSAQPAVSVTVSMLLAFVGGVILNLMPCVFPVLAIKILSFAHHSNSPRALRFSAYAYTAGVVLSLLVLAGILLALRAGGAALGWGFQLQNPYIVGALGLLFAVLGFNFLGWFAIPSIPLPARFGQQRSPAVEAFLSGILTVLVATPCSAPFVGTALAAALVLPAAHALLLFVCMALGLSVPVLLASVFPKLVGWLPKPGAWMEQLRQVMAFFMFASAIWLAWVLGKQSGVDAVALFMLVVLWLAGICWAWRIPDRTRRWWVAVFSALSILGLSAGVWHVQSAPSPSAQTSGNWQAWSEHAVQEAVQNQRKVFVDYTAAWCITCQLNKQTVLERASFQQWAQDNQVLLLRADWTNQDPKVSQSLQKLGRVSVPTYALYHPNRPNQPTVLGEVIRLADIQRVLR